LGQCAGPVAVTVTWPAGTVTQDTVDPLHYYTATESGFVLFR